MRRWLFEGMFVKNKDHGNKMLCNLKELTLLTPLLTKSFSDCLKKQLRLGAVLTIVTLMRVSS